MSINKYIAAVPADRAERFNAIVDLIITMYPKAEQSMEYRMPTFRNGDKGWVAVANQKQYVSVYTCGFHHLEAFKKKHPEIKTGKGCINIRNNDTLSAKELKPVIKSAMNG